MDGMSGMPGMSGMDGTDGSSSNMTMATMMVVFQTSIFTPLYSLAWTPTGPGAYAGTCIFLILLAALMRGLLALKAWQEGRWLDRELNRRFVVVNGRQPLAERASADSMAKRVTLTENGCEEDVMVVRSHRLHARPWRWSIDPVRACIDTAIAGVGYLLMLSVMTVNVGYFLSVLAGTFLGSVIVGRFTVLSEH